MLDVLNSAIAGLNAELLGVLAGFPPPVHPAEFGPVMDALANVSGSSPPSPTPFISSFLI